MPEGCIRTVFFYPLVFIPMFVSWVAMLFAAGIGKKLFEVAHALSAYARGLAVATIAASTYLVPLWFKPVLPVLPLENSYPEMKRLATRTGITGTVTVAGGLGVMIPPSTIFIVYGILTEQSIGKLFVAGIIPGIILATLFIITVYIICRRNPSCGPVGPATSWKQKFVSLKGLIESAILFLVTIGGLFAGWFTPTQAGAIGAAVVILLGLLNRQLTWAKFIEATRDGLRLSCMILLLIAGATIFGHFITRTALPMKLANYVISMNLSATVVMLLIIVFWFILGCFIDAMPIIVLLRPILLPILTTLEGV